ncbi:hypothetical protein BDK92_6840 [Micromonospora pisi]|uniref:Uncharacterized protein n=1 Tax=Micromonospora pisi TaxID=589240 RepID=A0A495JU89_9ACTN|nr:hypothetical protein [Micromonospora pisi]RKR92401.1 hypothetical protein BDK92_6840 [Micromonospora pisi]
MSKISTRRSSIALASVLGVLVTLAGGATPAVAEDRASIAAGVVRYNAIWEPGDDARPRVHTYTSHDLLERNSELFNQGYRIDSISQTRLDNGESRYDAIWRPGSGSSPVVIGWSEQQFWNQNAIYWEQGLRLWRVNRYLHNGAFHYDGIWKPGTDGRRVAAGWTLAALQAEDIRMRAQGYRLIQTAGVRENLLGSEIRYIGIWMPGTDARPTLFGATWDEMIQANANHWTSGYRTKYLNVYRTHQGHLRYDVIWEPGNDGRPVITAPAYAELMARDAELQTAGYRMTVVQGYVSPS